MTRPDGKPSDQDVDFTRSAFSEYHAQLHEFLLRRLRHAPDAHDALQEVFLRLLRLERRELIRNPQAYLYGIASHVVREFRGTQQRERSARDARMVEALADSPRALSPDELADSLGTERELERALALLPPVELKILVYDRCDGLSHEAIAKKMGLSVHTVKKYFFRALAVLRSNLDPGEGA